MKNVEIKMHSVLCFSGNEAEKIIPFFVNKVSSLDNKKIKIKKINIDDVTQKSFEDANFIIFESKLNNKLLDIATLAKEQDFNFKILNTDLDINVSKKDSIYRFFENVDKDSKFSFVDFDLWNNCHYFGDEVFFIGDIHENTAPLLEMIKKVPSNCQLVLLGDYLDKGGETEKTIYLIESLIASGAKMVIANHESYVAKRLLGEIKGMDKEEDIFSSLPLLMKNEKLASKVIDLYKKSIPFFCFDADIGNVYATHAPCKSKYLGKLSSNAQRSQRNFYFPQRGIEAMRNDLSFLNNDELKGLHVFGHVAHKMDKIYSNNRIWLDTGSVYGNMLSGVHINKAGDLNFHHVKAVGLTKDDLFSFEEKKKYIV